MRRLLRVAILALILAVPAANAGDLVLKKGDRVAIVGDSITEQKLYSRFMEAYLLACVPQLDLTVYQFGWSGERAPGFANRMENDFVWWQPTVVTTCFGMNDGGYRAYDENIGKTYRDGTGRIQTRCKELGARMIVGGPGPVDVDTWRSNEPDADKYYNDNLGQLSKIAGELAAQNGFVFAGLHPLMYKVMTDAKAQYGPGYHVCGSDGVHPWANGHLVMAYAFLKAMGLDGNIGTITVDMQDGATATDGHKVLAAKDGKVEIESTRYPFCFSGGEKDPRGNLSILPFLPFNRDLNRYLLVVKNLPTASAEVTWGNATKVFTKAELESGVNLADQFLDNPFSQPFAHLEQVVAQKQNRETNAIKRMITSFPTFERDFKDDAECMAAIGVLRRKLAEQSAADAAQARAAVVPVTHTIVVAPK